MLRKELLGILVCPRCKGRLEYDVKAGELICYKCRCAYPIKDDIPIMVMDKARKLND